MTDPKIAEAIETHKAQKAEEKEMGRLLSENKIIIGHQEKLLSTAETIDQREREKLD